MTRTSKLMTGGSRRGRRARRYGGGIAAFLLLSALLAALPPASVAQTPGSPGARIYIAGDQTGTVDVFRGDGTRVRSFDGAFTGGDRLAAGDLTGDGVDEVVIAGDETGTVDVFDGDGARVRSFDGGFTGGDGLAVGDVDGDGLDEVVIAGDQTGVVDVFDGDGARVRSFDGAFTGGDGLAVGDLTGDGADEVVIAGDETGTVDVFSGDGARVRSFDGAFTGGDGLAAGDLTGDGVDEVVIAGDQTGAVDVFGGDGARVGSFGGGFTGGDGLAVGDVDGDGADEVVIAGDQTGVVDVFDGDGARVGRFDGAFTEGDGLAVGTFERDTDGDGLSDRIELSGIPLPGGGTDTFLPNAGANPCRKTIAVEIDWLDDGAISDEPATAALNEARDMFDAAPVPAVATCPYQAFAGSPDGIQLLIDTSNAISVTPAERNTPLNLVDPATGETPFATYRRANFPAARENLFHYSLWGARHDNSGSSGVASPDGFPHDFLVTVGSWNGNNPSVRTESGTFVHELGHVLGLRHGGGDDANYKPNYLSVMSYTYQLTGIPDWSDWLAVAVPTPSPNRALLESVSGIDYSRQALPTLDRLHLNEPAGVGAAGDPTIFWTDNTMARQTGDGSGGLDWDFDTGGVSATDTNVAVDINGAFQLCVDGDAGGETPVVLSTTAAAGDVAAGTGIFAGLDGVCDTAAAATDLQARPVGFDYPATFGYTTGLAGFEDWSRIQLRVGVGPDSGQPLPGADQTELTESQADALVDQLIQALVRATGADLAATVGLPDRVQIPVGSTRPVRVDAAITNGGPLSPVDASFALEVTGDAGLDLDGGPFQGTRTVEVGAPVDLGRTVQVRCDQPGLQRITASLSVSPVRAPDRRPANNTASDSVTIDCVVGILALRSDNGQGAETVDVNGTGRWTFTAGGAHSNGGALIQQASSLTLQNGATLTTSTRPARCTRSEPGCPPAGTVTQLRPLVADPLAAVPEPSAGLPERTFPNCNDGQTCGPIEPGRYRGTINLNGGTVLLRPGLYVFEDGLVALGGTLAMAPGAGADEGVTLAFRRGASLEIRDRGGLRLRAPGSGDYAGIVVAYSRDNDASLGWRGSRTSVTSTGGVPTVYAPRASLLFLNDAAYDTPLRFIAGTVSNQATSIRFMP